MTTEGCTSRDRNQSLSLQQDAIALLALHPLLGGFIPLTSSAMKPTALQLLANEVVINSRTRVVECGSGISTVILGSILRETGGSLLSIEHDASWMEKVRGWIVTRGLDMIVRFVHAPLQETEIQKTSAMWYDTVALDAAISNSTFDFLVVDGPPAYLPGEEYRRSSALDYFFKHLDDDCSIVLDDIDRPAEREIAQRWSVDYSMSFDLRPNMGNVAIARRGQAFYC